LTPDGLSLGLNTGDAVEDSDSSVEYTEGTLDLKGEVNVAGSVDDVDAVIIPFRVVAAEVMVMPRSCSCSIQSMVAPPSWTSPIL